MAVTLFTACLGTETNSFSPIPTGLELFKRSMFIRNGEHGEHPGLFALPLIEWKRLALERDWEVVEGLAAFATPAGTTTKPAYEALRDEILEDLERAMPVDIVMLNLHGAMIADGYFDAEGDLLRCIRDRIGPDIPLLAELDLHGHQTQLKLDMADVLIYYKEYPHIDSVKRARELFDIAVRMLEDGLKPVMAMHDCRMLGIYPTTREPMISFVKRMQALEQEPGILSVSLAHGFPWGDTPEVGTRVVVVTDNDEELARQTADTLGQWVWQNRDDLLAPFISQETAIANTLQAPPGDSPFVIADTADNTGIGAAGDSTFVLQALIDRGVGGYAISPLWDPGAVDLAFEAGLGASLPMRIGGKLGPASGAPVDTTVTVMGLKHKGRQSFGGSSAPLGDMAWLRIGDAEDDDNAIDVVCNNHRVQAFHPDCFSEVGLDPMKVKSLVVKSTQHFHAGFGPIAREVLYAATEGTGSMDYANLPHEHVKEPLWPGVPDPHGAS